MKSVLLVLGVLAVTACNAGLLALDRDDLIDLSSHSFTGSITRLETQEVKKKDHKPGEYDRHFKAVVKVTSIFKNGEKKNDGKDSAKRNKANTHKLAAGDEVVVMSWKAFLTKGNKGPKGITEEPLEGNNYDFYALGLGGAPGSAERGLYAASQFRSDDDTQAVPHFKCLPPNGLQLQVQSEEM